MSILCVTLNPAIDVSSDVARIRPTRKMRIHNQRQEAGGGAVNVARVIAELGGDPQVLIVSGGATGALLEDALRSLPLRLDVVRTAEPTRIAFMVHEEETNLEYRFVPEGPLISEAEVEAVLDRAGRWHGGYLIGSGSLPRGAPADTYARMAVSAAAHDTRFVLDTSGEPLRQALEQGNIFLVKPSLGELESIMGEKLSPGTAGEAAQALIARGCARYIAVTLGADGALLASADGVLRVPAADIAVRSAVGAGDAFVGALTWFLAEGQPLEDAFRFGIAAGAAAVMTTGVELCRKEDVYGIYSRSLQAAE